MARDHYLPAAFIGRFSNENTSPARARSLYVHRLKERSTKLTTPEEIGFKENLYDLVATPSKRTIESWGYETNLQKVLEKLTNNETIDLIEWSYVLVPFVTGLFVRGSEFNDRYESQPVLKNLMQTKSINADNTNGSRVIRLQRSLAPVIGSNWKVMHRHPNDPQLITNNLGLVLTQDLHNNEVGWAIPLDRSTLLGLFPSKKRQIAEYDNGRWQPKIDHINPPEGTFSDFNKQVALSATEFIIGAEKSVLDSLVTYINRPTHDSRFIMEAPWAKMFSREELVAHEFDWYYLAGLASQKVSPLSLMMHGYKFNWDHLDTKSWAPPMVIWPLNLTRFPSGIFWYGNKLYVNLELLDDFKKHIKGPK